MPRLDRMPDRPRAVDARPGASLQPRVVLPREPRRVLRIARQQLEERLETAEVERPLRAELPEDRPELLVEAQRARGEEVRERALTSRSFFMCVMKREPLIAKRKPGGVASYQRRNDSGAGARRTFR